MYKPDAKDEDFYEQRKKSKGVGKDHLEKRIDFDDYHNCLFNQKLIKLGDNNTQAKHQRNPIYSFRSAGMTQFTVATQKICLSSNDDKRYPLSNKPTTTLALGHYYIDEM